MTKIHQLETQTLSSTENSYQQRNILVVSSMQEIYLHILLEIMPSEMEVAPLEAISGTYNMHLILYLLQKNYRVSFGAGFATVCIADNDNSL